MGLFLISGYDPWLHYLRVNVVCIHGPYQQLFGIVGIEHQVFAKMHMRVNDSHNVSSCAY
jgi:hypothetical protein